MSSKQSSHNQYQREYFDTVERARLAIGETPYVLAHVDRVVAAAGLKPGQRILEVGAGPGKFTLPLVSGGLDVVANDLSPVLLERLHQTTKHLSCNGLTRLSLRLRHVSRRQSIRIFAAICMERSCAGATAG